jgi:hypothetical protein
VDRAVHALEAQVANSYDDWKISPAFQRTVPDAGLRFSAATGDPTPPEFDDSSWKEIKLGAPIDLESCWLRKEIVLPEVVLGQQVGGVAKLRLTTSGMGELWVNGESKGRLGREPDVELTKDAKPGQRFAVVIRASQSPGQGGLGRPGQVRLSRAELVLDRTKVVRQQVEDLVLSLRVAQKLLSFDTYQTSARNKVDLGIDRSTIDKAERTRLNN